MTNAYQCPPFGSSTFIFLYPLVAMGFIDGWFVVLCTWIFIIGLVNTIYGVPTTLILIFGNLKLLLKFLFTKDPLDPGLTFITDLITTHFLTTSMLGAIIVSTLVVIMTTLNDWIISILVNCLWVLIIVAFDIIGEVVLTWVQQCSILWLPIGSFYGVKCGWEYIFGFLFLNWMDGWIYWLYGPNWLPNSMPLSLF